MAQVVLADEINRATPKTQSALLEAMEEQQITVDGVTHYLEAPFLVMATQNPIEYEGTFPLPEAQLDRFLMRISLGYPDFTEELSIIDDGGDADDRHREARPRHRAEEELAVGDGPAEGERHRRERSGVAAAARAVRRHLPQARHRSESRAAPR